MPPKKFEGKFGIPASHGADQELTSALYRLSDSLSPDSPEFVESLTHDIAGKVNELLALNYDAAYENNDVEVAKLQRSLTEEQVKILHLKLARYFEYTTERQEDGKVKDVSKQASDIPVSDLVDALAETPRFLESVQGGIDKVLKIHEMKTLQKIAEKRKEYRLTDNPYENLFETVSGEYYLARLLNLPHLEEESEYMSHCVGTVKSYINMIRRGDIEIFSFRSKDFDGQKIIDKPVVTIEYDVKGKRLLQVKASNNDIPNLNDFYAADLIDALDKLSETVNDKGESRTIINSPTPSLKRLASIREKLKNEQVLTRDELLFLYEVNRSIQGFEGGGEPSVKGLRFVMRKDRTEDIKVMCNCPEEYIATDFLELNESTLVYVEDDGDNLTLIDFREERNKGKLPKLVDLAKKIKETGSSARPDMTLEGGVLDIEVPLEKVKDLPTAIASYEETDNNSPSWAWSEWQQIEYTKLESPQLEVFILSYNNDLSIRESSEKIIEDADMLGLRPATFEEMVALGIVKPEFNKMPNKYLVGLTKYSLNGRVMAPYLRWHASERNLSGVGWFVDWVSLARFVFVRK